MHPSKKPSSAGAAPSYDVAPWQQVLGQLQAAQSGVEDQPSGVPATQRPPKTESDLVNFALTCKKVHGVAKDALKEHRALLKQWHKVNNQSKGKKYLASIVARLFLKPWLRSYIQVLDLESLEADPSNPQSTHFDGESAPESSNAEDRSNRKVISLRDDPTQWPATNEALRPLLDARFGTSFWAEWQLAVQNDSFSMPLGSMCFLLREIKQLDIHMVTQDVAFMQQLLKPHVNGSHSPFAKLECLSIFNDAPTNMIAWQVRRSNLGPYWTIQNLNRGSHPFFFNIRELVLDNVILETRDLQGLLAYMPKLTLFAYIQRQRRLNHTVTTDWRILMNTLRISRTKSLKSLTISHAEYSKDLSGWPIAFEKPDDDPLRYLRPVDDFEALEDLALEWDVVAQILRGTLLTPRSGLPPSLRRLTLTNIYRPAPVEMMASLTFLLGVKKSSLPQLGLLELPSILLEVKYAKDLRANLRDLEAKGVGIEENLPLSAWRR